MIASRKLHIAVKTIDTLCDLNYPTITAELRSFLGLCSVYCRFVPNSILMAALLNRQHKKGEPATFEVNDGDRHTIDGLKEKLKKPPVPALAGYEGQFVFETYACDKQVECVLLQEKDKNELRLIGY